MDGGNILGKIVTLLPCLFFWNSFQINRKNKDLNQTISRAHLPNIVYLLLWINPVGMEIFFMKRLPNPGMHGRLFFLNERNAYFKVIREQIVKPRIWKVFVPVILYKSLLLKKTAQIWEANSQISRPHSLTAVKARSFSLQLILLIPHSS